MYNSDGVELEYPRQNANMVDLERDWDKNPMQPESAALKLRFSQLMSSEEPIEVALNMHSSTACTRFFVYHDSVGTSSYFTLLEQDFIGDVRNYYPEGIEPWNYYVSWTSGTPTHFPESWFWFNFRESVMALTYEDMNCEAAGNYQQTAYALLHGIADYLGLVSTILITDGDEVSGNFSLDQNYPNPVQLSKNSSASTVIQYQLETSQRIKLSLFDVLGRQIRVIESGLRGPGIHRIFIDVSNLANGTYFYQLQTSGGRQVRQLNILR
jgi:hypothetical protein